MFNSEDRRGMVTPLDLRQARFKTAVRGFDKAQVTAIIEEASAGYEDALRENERLRQDMIRLEASLHQFRELESGLKATLLSAHKVADDLRDHAEQHAARILADAERTAAVMLQQAQARVDDAQREIAMMRLKRREAETTIEATISALHSTLEFAREQDGSPEVVAIRVV